MFMGNGVFLLLYQTLFPSAEREGERQGLRVCVVECTSASKTLLQRDMAGVFVPPSPYLWFILERARVEEWL